MDVAPLDIAELPHAVAERSKMPRQRRVGAGMENTDGVELARRLLRARRERPRSRRAAEQGNELTPLHSITSSAMESTPGGTSMPSACAVCRLMTNSNLVD